MKYHLNPKRRTKAIAVRLSPEEWQKLDILTSAMGTGKSTDTIRALINAEVDIRTYLNEILKISRSLAEKQEVTQGQIRRLETMLSPQAPTPKGGIGSPHNRR